MRSQRLATDRNPNFFSSDLEELLRSSGGFLAACQAPDNVLVRLRVDGFVYVVARFPAQRLDSLTSRQREVAMLAAAGWSLGDIAAHLRISRPSIAKHLQKVYEKLQVHCRAALAGVMVGLALQGALPAVRAPHRARHQVPPASTIFAPESLPYG